jgi:hypothetical protein
MSNNNTTLDTDAGFVMGKQQPLQLNTTLDSSANKKLVEADIKIKIKINNLIIFYCSH